MPTRWTETTINYCERLTLDFWAEPFNALSNLAFVMASGLLLARLWRRPGAPLSHYWQATMVGVIGVGSFLFHTFATFWAQAADIVPIQLFILGYLVNFARWQAGVPWRRAWLTVPVFIVFELGCRKFFGLFPLNNSGNYASALFALLGFTFQVWRAGQARWPPFALATGLFAVSLIFRTIDPWICPSFPIGTHCFWHLCNAGTLYLVTGALPMDTQAR